MQATKFHMIQQENQKLIFCCPTKTLCLNNLSVENNQSLINMRIRHVVVTICWLIYQTLLEIEEGLTLIIVIFFPQKCIQ
jgi:hypothetical protein